MDNISKEDILDMYEKIEIQVEDNNIAQDKLIFNKWNFIPFGIYTKNGFNYSNNTNSNHMAENK